MVKLKGSQAVYRDLYLIGDTKYNIIFVHDALSTFCIIRWQDKDGIHHESFGASYCNPADEFDPERGECLAMQRACSIGEYPQSLDWCLVLHPAYDLRPVYSAYREARRIARMEE